MNRRRILATGALFALAGCVTYPDSDDEPPSSEALIREAIEVRRHMSDLEARRVMTVETPDEAVERTERVVRKPPAKQRIEVRESTDPDVPAGSVTVTNRATTWEYDPATETVDKQYHPNKTDTDRTRLVLEALLSDYRLSYEGTETVDGRTAHVIETQPPVDDDGPTVELVVGDTTYVVPVDIIQDLEQLDVSRQVWIDDEYRYPIRERTVHTEDGETRHELDVTYEDLAIDEGLDRGSFTYEPPADATVHTDGREPEGVFDTRTDAEAILPYDLPAPDVPDAYLLDRITVVERDQQYGGTTTTLWYNDPNVVARELYVTVRAFQRFDPDPLEETEIGGRTVYRSDGRKEQLFWTCDSVSYEIGCLIQDAPLEAIAASIGCS